MWSVIGHDWVVKMWQSSIAQERIGHAYLLTGPAQVGKRTLALGFAQALNCTSDNKPCGKCRSCLKIAHANHPDVKVIESQGSSIKIEQIRQLQNDVALSPHESPWKVYVLRNMEQATLEAANCLLKTLEEPPSRVVLILTASNTNRLLPTIVSRCQVLALRPLSSDLIEQALVDRWQAKPDQAHLLARLAGGRIGWAIAALQDEGLLTKRSQTIVDLLDILAAHRFERMRYAEKLGRQRDDALSVLDVWKVWWRDLLLTKLNTENMTVNIDYLDDLRNWASAFAAQQITEFLTHVLVATRRIEQDANARLVLESLFLKLPLTSQRNK